MQVNSLAEAQQWFLKHPEGSVKCKNGSRWRICSSMEEAAEWYGGDKEDG